MDLKEEERRRIRAEELYRFEVRQRLDSDLKSSRRTGLWVFLNSSFGLWLLTAVFVTGASFLYNHIKTEYASVLAKSETTEQLDIEISYRLSRVLENMRYRLDLAEKRTRFRGENSMDVHGKIPVSTATSPIHAENVSANIGLTDIVNQIERAPHTNTLLVEAPSGRYPSLYPKYINHSLVNLLTDLRVQVPPPERPAIDKTLATIANAFVDERTLASENDSSTARICWSARDLISKLMLARWQRYPFDYVGCSQVDPFCYSFSHSLCYNKDQESWMVMPP